MSTSTIPPIKSGVRHIRPHRINARWTPPDDHVLKTWVSRLGHEKSNILLTILGPNPVYRAEAYRLFEGGDIFQVVVDKSTYSYDWIGDSLIENLIKRVSIPNILSILAARSELLMGPELTHFLDRGYFRVSEAFRVLWEARFLFDEDQPEEADLLLQELAEWSVGQPPKVLLARLGVHQPVASTVERYDMILLWLTLARFNGVLDRLILPYDGFERVQGDEGKISELRDLLQAAERWASLGSPLGIVVGVPHLNLAPHLKDLLLESVV